MIISQVKRYEITEVTPDEQISTAMDRQAAAERMRRERVLTAEGEKRAATLKSEGVKIQLINESEGALIRVSTPFLCPVSIFPTPPHTVPYTGTK